MNATAIFHAVTDRLLVYIQSDVIHILHGGSVSESASAEFSFLYTKRSSFDLCIQTKHKFESLPTRDHCTNYQ
jgi:hypothetical protein